MHNRTRFKPFVCTRDSLHALRVKIKSNLRPGSTIHCETNAAVLSRGNVIIIGTRIRHDLLVEPSALCIHIELYVRIHALLQRRVVIDLK